MPKPLGATWMTPKEFAEAMRRIFPNSGYDEEAAHSDADALMCSILEGLGYSEGVTIFKLAEKWYA